MFAKLKNQQRHVKEYIIMEEKTLCRRKKNSDNQ